MSVIILESIFAKSIPIRAPFLLGGNRPSVEVSKIVVFNFVIVCNLFSHMSGTEQSSCNQSTHGL